MAFYTREESAEFKEIAGKHIQIPMYGMVIVVKSLCLVDSI